LRDQKQKEREEQHLYVAVRVITETTFKAHQGTDLTTFDGDPESNPAVAKHYRLLRSTTVQELINRIAADTAQEAHKVRLWVMVNRQNKTVRPDQPLMDMNITIESALTKADPRSNDLRVWAEIAEEFKDGKALWPGMQPQAKGNSFILLFLKHFDVQSQILKGVGHIWIRELGKVSELAGPILGLMDWPMGTSLSLYEVSACSFTS
jgi:ubiquitin carboxyl-terminal hydrolase 7